MNFPQKVLITGGAGFIGSHLAESLRQDGAEVRVLDNFRTGNRSHLDGLGVELMEGSILDPELLGASMRDVDAVYHLAAMPGVEESFSDPAGCHELNAQGTLRVLEAAVAAGVKRFLFASSAAVYGNHPDDPKKETTRPEPQSPYAITKLTGENLCRWFTRTGRLQTVTLRFFNVFGPRQNPHGPHTPAVAGFLHKALTGEPLTIHGDGAQTRDFIYVKDLTAAMLHVMERQELTGVYNVGYGTALSIREVAERIIAMTGSRSGIVLEIARGGGIRNSRAAVEALQATGFCPPFGFERGLSETADSFRDGLVQESAGTASNLEKNARIHIAGHLSGEFCGISAVMPVSRNGEGRKFPTPEQI